MGARSDVSRTRVLFGDPSRRCGIEWTREAAVDRKRLRHWWWQLGEHETRANRLDLARASLHDDAGDQTAGRIDGNRSDRVPLPRGRRHEVEWLARHRAPNRDYRVRVQCRRAGNKCEEGNCCLDASSHGLLRLEEVSRKLTIWYSSAGPGVQGYSAEKAVGIDPRTVLEGGKAHAARIGSYTVQFAQQDLAN